MIDDYSRDLLRSGIIELKAGNRDAARRYLDRALYMSSDHDVMAEAWYQMSFLDDDPAQRRLDIENCLAHDLRHARARRVLAILDGRLKPNEIVDPDAAKASLEDTGAMRLSPVGARTARLPSEADAQRFMCPKCGGRMTFGPEGQSLVCEYCARHQSLGTARTSAPQADFLLAMATARGHSKPLAEQVFHCRGCGAEFILPPGKLSITCPYCGSPHVIGFDKSPDLIAPNGIIPHAFDQNKATALLAAWLQKNLTRPKSVGTSVRGTSPLPSESTVDRVRVNTGKLASPTLPNFATPRGLYLPLWTFDLGGMVDYTGEVIEEQDQELGRRTPRVVRVNEVYPVMMAMLPIPASRKLSGPFVHLLPTFNLKIVQPYDPRYLSDWPAELYDIPMDEASLDARSQGFALVKRDMEVRVAPMHVVSSSSARMDVESFQLVLVPVWISEVSSGGGRHLVLINGETGDAWGDLGGRADKSKGSLMDWLGDLI